MSGAPAKRTTAVSIRARKDAEKITCLTCYTAPMARLLDPLVDMLLVGDSLGMVVYGMESTVTVSLDMMLAHTRAVAAHSTQALVVADLPFGAYQSSPSQAFKSATLLMQAGAGAVKLEGGVAMAPTIRFLTDRGIPVVAHIGLLPQHVHKMGGYRIQGRKEQGRAQLLKDTRAIADAGAFAVVIEGVTEETAAAITQATPIPTIGIGASKECDGQVLVIDDLLGLTHNPPKFAKQYADLAAAVTKAATQFASDVRSGKFPAKEHVF